VVVSGVERSAGETASRIATALGRLGRRVAVSDAPIDGHLAAEGRAVDADLLVVSTPPLVAGTAAVTAASRSDALLVVVHAGRTRTAQIADTLLLLAQTGCTVLGVLLVRRVERAVR
jgi:hypothetical protein